MNNWNYEKDAYNDDSWDITTNNYHYELRIFPNIHNWSLLLVKFEKNNILAKAISKRTLKKADNKADLSNYAKKYIIKSNLGGC